MNVRYKVALAGVSAAVASLVGAVVAYATPTTVADPTGGAYSTGVSQSQSWITSTGSGPLFVLGAVVLIIAIALKFFRKARSAV